jgi:hypothetical protein
VHGIEGCPGRESCAAVINAGKNSRMPAPAEGRERGCQLGSAEKHIEIVLSFP